MKLKHRLSLAIKTLIAIPVGIIGLCLALVAAVLVFRGSILEDIVRNVITHNTPVEELTELISEPEAKAVERRAEDQKDAVVAIPDKATVYNSLLQEWRELSLNSRGTFEALIARHADRQHMTANGGVITNEAASRCNEFRQFYRLRSCRDLLVGEWFIAAHENHESGKLAMRVPWPTYTIRLREDATFEWSEDLKLLWGWPNRVRWNTPPNGASPTQTSTVGSRAYAVRTSSVGHWGQTFAVTRIVAFGGRSMRRDMPGSL